MHVHRIKCALGFFMLIALSVQGQKLQFGLRGLSTDFNRTLRFSPLDAELEFPSGVGAYIGFPYTKFLLFGIDARAFKIRNAHDELLLYQDEKMKYHLAGIARIQRLERGYFFKPFIQGGVGVQTLEGEAAWHSAAHLGVGVDFEIFRGLAIGVNSSFTRELARNRYFVEYGIGLSYAINDYKAKEVMLDEILVDQDDWDGDGIPNDGDRCPQVAGSLMTSGCPDQDEDGVPDRDDACPDQPGLVGNGGCPVFADQALLKGALDTLKIERPGGHDIFEHQNEKVDKEIMDLGYNSIDSDQDGVPDRLDQCPQIYGNLDNNGCPESDSDNDGVSDEKDQCPDLAGSIFNKGCPEDMNLVEKDLLVEENELPSEKSSPPGWGEGSEKSEVVDARKDFSNEVPPSQEVDMVKDSGLVKMDDSSIIKEGGGSKDRPDGQGEGKAEMADLQSANKEKNVVVELGQGSAVRDFEQTVVRNRDFPDRDNDGIADRIDPCPDLYGILKNYGCPDSATQEHTSKDVKGQGDDVGEIIHAEVNLKDEGLGEKDRFGYVPMVHFKPGQAALQRESIADLNAIASFMLNHPQYDLKIYGHTDSKGSEHVNNLLSERRAKACYIFLALSGGVPTRRMTFHGVGEHSPISDNYTSAGRYENRRVVFDFIRK